MAGDAGIGAEGRLRPRTNMATMSGCNSDCGEVRLGQARGFVYIRPLTWLLSSS